MVTTMIVLLIVKVTDTADNNMKITLLYSDISCGGMNYEVIVIVLWC